MPTRHRHHRPARRARPPARSAARALTMIEVVLASVLLALVAIASSTTISFLVRCQTDDKRRLGGYELANRKILEYLDDKKSIGSSSAPQELYGFRYRWELDDTKNLSMAVKQSEAAARSASQLRTDRFVIINVTVWAVDERVAAATGVPAKGEEVAHLTRITDPISAMMFRNPDSRDNGISNGDSLARLMEMLTGGASVPKDSGSSTPSSSSGGKSTPAAPTSKR